MGPEAASSRAGKRTRLPWQEGSGREGSYCTGDQVAPWSWLRAQARQRRSCRLRMFMYTPPSAVSTTAHSSEASRVSLAPRCQVAPWSSLKKAYEDCTLPQLGEGVQVRGPGLSSAQAGISSLPPDSWMPWPGPGPTKAQAGSLT
jgi:hypothetical protein